MMLMKYKHNTTLSRGSEAPRILATVRLSDGGGRTLDAIAAEGGDILKQFGNFAIVSMPLDAAERIAATKGVKSLSFGVEAKADMDKARQKSSVDMVHRGLLRSDAGESIPMYTGSGVITGVYDTGFDMTHINFTDFSGDSRIRRVTLVNPDKTSETGFSVRILDTPESIEQKRTDDASNQHGTHVAGIMSGGYNRAGTAVKVTDDANARPIISNLAMPFYGIAKDADIVMGAGSLQMSAILLGVSDMIEYAESQGKPLVVNLSLGHNGGTHDGSDDFSQALAELGKDAIIVVSAGNEGDIDLALRGKITEETPVLKSFFDFPVDKGLSDGATFIVPDGTPLNGRLIVYDTSTNTELAQAKLLEDRYAGFADNTVPDIALDRNSNYTSAFTGAVYGFRGFDENTGKGYVYITTENIKLRSANSSIRIGIELSAPAGTEIYGYGMKEAPFVSMMIDGWTKGTTDGSISGMACGDNIISVGSYTSSRNYGSLGNTNSYFYNPDNIVNSISSFSSYGHLTDGRCLPHITAPGSVIISSFSRYYVKDKNLEESKMTGKAIDSNDEPNYWGSMSGTSMASPHVAGIVALMLEADPTLNHSEVLEIISNSATEDNFTAIAPARWGAGKINAAEAIKQVWARKSAGIEGAIADGLPGVTVTSDGSYHTVYAAGAAGVSLILTDMTGKQVGQASATGSTASISSASLQPGIYVLSISTSDGRRSSQKIAIK